MAFIKMCPICEEVVSPRELRAYSSVVGLPRTSPCPHCRMLLKWSLGWWYIAHIGGFVTFLGAFLGALGLFNSFVSLIDFISVNSLFVTTELGILIMFVGVWQVNLVEVKKRTTV